jgi:hypothetical protein
MRLRCAIAMAAAVLLSTGAGHAQELSDYDALRTAQDYLQRASDYLHGAPNDPQGRRDKAIEYVNRALAEVQSALGGEAPAGSRERKMQNRAEQLENKRLQREQQLEQKQLQRQQQQENR